VTNNFKAVENEIRFAAEKMQKVNLFESRNFFCDVYGLEPGQEQKTHTHSDADKIYYVISGSGTFVVGDETREAVTGDIVFAPSGQEHGVRSSNQGRLVLLVFMSPNPNAIAQDERSPR
jgi:mannose-6-phosphate isomerase-like protein (cupin superfamily)